MVCYETKGDDDARSNQKKEVSQINGSLALNIATWLRKRGKTVRPKLSKTQRAQLKECFELMDADGSGAIDADELFAAFKLLGMRVKKQEVEAMLAEVDRDGSGEVEYPEFLEIMTSTLTKLAEERDEAAQQGKGGNSEPGLPFSLMATAYRRKRLMEGLISRDKEMQVQISQMADDLSDTEQVGSSQAPSTANKTGNGPEASSIRYVDVLGDEFEPEPLFGDEEERILATLLPGRLRDIAPSPDPSNNPTSGGEGSRGAGFPITLQDKQLIEVPKVRTFKFHLNGTGRRKRHRANTVSHALSPTPLPQNGPPFLPAINCPGKENTATKFMKSVQLLDSRQLTGRCPSWKGHADVVKTQQNAGNAVKNSPGHDKENIPEHGRWSAFEPETYGGKQSLCTRSVRASPAGKMLTSVGDRDRLRLPQINDIAQGKVLNVLPQGNKARVKFDVCKLWEEDGSARSSNPGSDDQDCDPLPSPLKGDITINRLRRKSLLQILA